MVWIELVAENADVMLKLIIEVYRADLNIQGMASRFNFY